MKKSVNLLFQFKDAINEEYKGYLDNTSTDMIRFELAIVLCKKAGHDPFEVVMGGSNNPPARGVDQSCCLYYPIYPQWWYYYGQAVTFLNALQEIEHESGGS